MKILIRFFLNNQYFFLFSVSYLVWPRVGLYPAVASNHYGFKSLENPQDDTSNENNNAIMRRKCNNTKISVLATINSTLLFSMQFSNIYGYTNYSQEQDRTASIAKEDISEAINARDQSLASIPLMTFHTISKFFQGISFRLGTFDILNLNSQSEQGILKKYINTKFKTTNTI